MYNLILNENMKIYRRWRTWIMSGILVLFMAISFFVTYGLVGTTSNQDWRAQSEQRVSEIRNSLAEADKPGNEMSLDAETRKMMEQDLKFEQHRLDKNIAPTEFTLWGEVLRLSGFVSLVIIFVIIVAGDSVAGEFSGGTIKLLLLQPASRSKILLGKYISVFLFAVFMILLVMLTAFVGGAIVHGFDGASTTYLTMSASGDIIERSMLLHTLVTYGLQCVMLVFVATIAFLISTVFRSSAMAISFAIGIQFSVPVLTVLVLQYDWAKYVLFVHIDLTQYLNNTPLIEGVKMPFAVSVLAVYFIVFNAITWLLFNRRDVA